MCGNIIQVTSKTVKSGPNEIVRAGGQLEEVAEYEKTLEYFNIHLSPDLQDILPSSFKGQNTSC